MKKKKGLLVWFEMDKRIELLQPFINMSDEIEFVHLHFRTREERLVDQSPFEIIYWFDYNTPYQLLQKHRPDFIVGATEGLLSISLIVAAKEKNIPFFGMQHGFTTENFLSIIQAEKRGFTNTVKKLKTHLKTTQFYFSSLRLSKKDRLFEYINLFILFFKNFPETALAKNRYEWVKPAVYICFSEISSLHYKQLYNLKDSEIKYVGIPSFDLLFKSIKKNENESFAVEKCFLLIDTNFTDYHKIITKEQIWRCYNEIAEFCKIQNAKLYIKLHPLSYKYDYEDNETILFVRNINHNELGKLIQQSLGCFGFYSTLTFPIAFIKPTVQIGYDGIIEQGLVDNNITPALDFYTFKARDINFCRDSRSKIELREKYLFSDDGNAGQRIKSILINSI